VALGLPDESGVPVGVSGCSLDCPIIRGFRLPALGKCGNEWTMKAGRNDPCPCGSGKKYKKCHGVNA